VIDFNFENSAKPRRGSILISEPFLDDDYFSRSVILLCDHNEEGSFGFVLNKYVESPLHELIEGFPKVEAKLSIGGPVDTSNLFFIHQFNDQLDESVKVTDQFFLGGNFENLKTLIETDNSNVKQIRFFLGYSGWTSDQLNEELEEKSWLVINDYNTDIVFSTDDNEIWKHLMEKMGGKFEVMSKFPINPSHN
jgi:putative transcriptional regulator